MRNMKKLELKRLIPIPAALTILALGGCGPAASPGAQNIAQPIPSSIPIGNLSSVMGNYCGSLEQIDLFGRAGWSQPFTLNLSIVQAPSNGQQANFANMIFSSTGANANAQFTSLA